MSFVEGIKAIPADIAAVPTREGKLRRAAEIGKILVDEVTGVLKAIPYGIRALRQHKKLPDALARSDDGAHVREVSIARNVRYADSPRAVMDVYLPRGVSLADEFALDADGRVVDAVATEASVETSGGEKRNKNDSFESLATKPGHPVALFIHGGVWAVGEKWQFAPMAHRLAEEGVVTCVATYSLFPRATAPRMWEEVSDALTFTMDNAARLCPGASAERVVLMGHSAGAHLCAMALMHRQGALATTEPTGAAVEVGSTLEARDEKDETPPTSRRVDTRQPRAFVGLCGVYDIDTHYKYEDSRGVALVSTMARAMGGRQGFDRASPLRLVRADPNAVAYDQNDQTARRTRRAERKTETRARRRRAMATGFCRTTTTTTRDARTIQTASSPMSLSIPSGTLKTISCGARTGRPWASWTRTRTSPSGRSSRGRVRRSPRRRKKKTRGKKKTTRARRDTRRRNGSRRA